MAKTWKSVLPDSHMGKPLHENYFARAGTWGKPFSGGKRVIPLSRLSARLVILHAAEISAGHLATRFLKQPAILSC